MFLVHPLQQVQFVTLLVNGAVKASLINVQTKIGDATQLNFDLRKANGAKNVGATGKKKHFQC